MRRHGQGFSLLETLAAMFLLALCFGALMRTAGASLALGNRSEGYTQASLWAASLMDRVFLVDFPADGVHQGDFDKNYHWTMHVAPAEVTTDSLVPQKLYKIDLTVEWSDGGRPVKTTFSTLRTIATRPVATSPVTGSGDG